jgi:hypothetical protein
MDTHLSAKERPVAFEREDVGVGRVELLSGRVQVQLLNVRV